MNKGKIALQECLRILDSGQWCRVRFVECNVSTGKAGKVAEYVKCKVSHKQNKEDRRENTEGEIATPILRSARNDESKRQNHGFHFTRNVQLVNEKLIRKVHVILITEINGWEVI